MSISDRPAEKSRSGRSSGAITLYEVARLAGVAPITVSRALNQPELVAAKTLEAVKNAVERTGYLPNLLAGGLASRKSRLVAAIVPTIGNSIFAEATESFSERLNEAGYKMLLGISNYSASKEEDLVTAVLSRRPDAIFLTGITHSRNTRSRLLAAQVPVVETWDYTSAPLDMLVGFSHEKLGQAVANYLYDKGYRRLGMVWASDERARLRQVAFLSTLAERGITDVQIASVEPPGTLKKGRDGIAEILNHRKPVEAVFCSSDILAHGVLTEAHARGISVPGQLAAIGFGDLEFAPHTFPALSTVHIDRSKIGHLAAEAVLARLDEREHGRIFDVGFKIVERGST